MDRGQLTGWGVKLYLLALGTVAIAVVSWLANRFVFPEEDPIVVFSGVAAVAVFGTFFWFFRDIVR